jgi:hypothetical protein
MTIQGLTPLLLLLLLLLLLPELGRMKEVAVQRGVSPAKIETEIADSNKPRFPTEIGKIARAAVVVDRDDFAATFDTGVPLDPTVIGNQQVLMIYNSPLALPKDRTLSNAAKHSGQIPVARSALEATENCDFLNVILTDFKANRNQCWALMGQYEAFHIQKFMRLPENGVMDRSHPLKLVNRGAQPNGRKSTKPPPAKNTLEYWKTLAPYLENLPSVLERLDPVAKKVAGASNTVVVMVCNFGQSDLLMNFVCTARARDLDLSHILLFATDMETKELAESLGIAVWYDEQVCDYFEYEYACLCLCVCVENDTTHD